MAHADRVDALAHRLRASAGCDEREFDSEHRLRSENLPFDIDVWYRPLARFTFPSLFIPLTRRAASAIVRNYDVAWRGKDICDPPPPLLLLLSLFALN